MSDYPLFLSPTVTLQINIFSLNGLFCYVCFYSHYFTSSIDTDRKDGERDTWSLGNTEFAFYQSGQLCGFLGGRSVFGHVSAHEAAHLEEEFQP